METTAGYRRTIVSENRASRNSNIWEYVSLLQTAGSLLRIFGKKEAMFLLRSSGADKTTMKSDTGELDSSRDASPSEIFGQHLLEDVSEHLRFSSCFAAVLPLNVLQTTSLVDIGRIPLREAGG